MTTTTIDLLDAWTPTMHPHLAVIGTPRARAAATERILDRYIGDLDGQAVIARDKGQPFPHRAESFDTIANQPEQIIRLLEQALQSLTRRYKILEEDPTVRFRPYVVVLDGFEALDEAVGRDRTGRFHDYLGDIFSLGRAVSVHVLITALEPQLAFSMPRHGVSHVVVDHLTPRGAVILGHHIDQHPPTPHGSAWFFAPSAAPKVVSIEESTR